MLVSVFNKLSDLEIKINHEYKFMSEAKNEAEAACNKYLLIAKRLGDYLLEAKSLVSHGGWEKWVCEHTQIPDRTARQAMQIARGWETIQKRADCAGISQLNIYSALNLLKHDPTLPAEFVEKPTSSSLTTYKPVIGDKVRILDTAFKDKPAEIKEILHDAIVICKINDGNEYPLLINQIEFDERWESTPIVQTPAKSIVHMEVEPTTNSSFVEEVVFDNSTSELKLVFTEVLIQAEGFIEAELMTKAKKLLEII